MEYKGDYLITIINIESKQMFEKYIKNEYFLNKFKNKCKYSKKIKIIGIKRVYY